MSARPQPQIAIDEQLVEDAELEQALEKREAEKMRAGAARKRYVDADAAARGLLARHESAIADQPVRVGRFVVRLRRLASRAVQFETAPATRLVIQPDREAD